MEILDNGDYRDPREHRNDSSHSGGLFIGVAFMVAGLVLLLHYTNMISSGLKNIILSWQMIVVAIGVYLLTRKQTTQGIILLLIGGIFLLPRLKFLPIFADWGYFSWISRATLWPILLIAIGILIFIRSGITNRGRNPNHNQKEFSKFTSRSDNGKVYYSLVFRGADNVFLEPVFRGGKIETVFGGLTLDLRKAELQEGISVLDLSTVFGGATLMVPPHWNVEVQSNCVFGGFKDNRPYADKLDTHSRLIIKVECVFGGAELK